MKRVFEHPKQTGGKRYWRSLDELEDTPEFRGWLEREFPQGAAEMEVDDVSRRNFVKLMGASMALAGFGMAGCRRPEQYMVPFSKGVEWTIPGKALYYASAMPRRGGALPLIVKCSDGRPIKIEGNPLHPASMGGTDALAQISVWDLYDPDRSTRFLMGGKTSKEEAFVKFLDEHKAKLVENGGAGVAFLVEESVSPTRDRLLTELRAKLPQLKWCVYEPVGDALFVEAAKASFGPNVKPVPKFDQAAVVLSLGNDFLESGDGDIIPSQAFSARRDFDKHGKEMSRLYVAENHYTNTGGMADHRLRLPAHRYGDFLKAVAAKVGVSGATDDGHWEGTDGDWITGVANDLIAHKGNSLVVVGRRLPVELQQLGFAINAALGNIGTTLVGMPSIRPASIPITELAAAISSGAIHTLFILGGNPAYNAPADLKWSEIVKAVPTTIRLGFSEDESSVGASWHVPSAHFLESWGDSFSPDGTYVPVQPMILPIFGGWSDLDLLAVLADRPKPEGPEIVKETFNLVAKPANLDEAWAVCLRDGFLANSAAPVAPLAYSGASPSIPPTPLDSGKFEVLLVSDYRVDDGRYTNNAWAQELADPITKLTWDNAALVSPATAKALNLGVYNMSKNRLSNAFSLIDIQVGDTKVTAAALVAPGHADNSITLSLGFGRTHVGRVGQGVGFNAYPLSTTKTPYLVTNATVTKVANSQYGLAVTQDHHTMDGRAIARETSVEDYLAHPTKEGEKPYIASFGMDSHIPANVSLYVPDKLDAPQQWAMTIDMNLCSGCNACVVACQSENNIPVVGKEQVINGREMHWMRIDRYFASENKDDTNPTMITQPMLCQHCENAPCETVCPVNATVHSEDGLNVMVYNRCIGTRYCANNCPYKVRRFNFFDYNKRNIYKKKDLPLVGDVNNLYFGPIGKENETELSRMQKNPNVTVRMRGVMEKCTFCVQRIEDAKITQLVRARDSKNTNVPTDSFQVACQQACTAGAIVFGDKKDENSQVHKMLKNERAYRVLEYLNVLPRVTYLARLKNLNPDMPDDEVIEQGMKDAMGMGGHHGEAHGAKDPHGAPYGEPAPAHGGAH